MNFKKMSIFHRGEDDEPEQEVQSESGGILAVWGSPGSGKTITAVKLAKALADKKQNVALLLCDMTAPMLPCICPSSVAANGLWGASLRYRMSAMPSSRITALR
jgi:Mrp family chromosome partitioning ATPase